MRRANYNLFNPYNKVSAQILSPQEKRGEEEQLQDGGQPRQSLASGLQWRRAVWRPIRYI